MKYEAQSGASGDWVDKSKVRNGQRAKIVSETKPIPSSFKDKEGNIKNQDVAKVRFEGENTPVNVALNRANITALIEAFGDDSIAWQNHYLTVEVEKTRIAGKAVTALYLIPEGFKKIDDAEGYAKIVPVSDTSGSSLSEADKETIRQAREAEMNHKEEEINPEDIPF